MTPTEGVPLYSEQAGEILRSLKTGDTFIMTDGEDSYEVTVGDVTDALDERVFIWPECSRHVP